MICTLCTLICTCNALAGAAASGSAPAGHVADLEELRKLLLEAKAEREQLLAERDQVCIWYLAAAAAAAAHSWLVGKWGW